MGEKSGSLFSMSTALLASAAIITGVLLFFPEQIGAITSEMTNLTSNGLSTVKN